MKTFLLIPLSLLSFTLLGCATDAIKLYDASTGKPAINYEVTMKTPSDVQPVVAQMHIVRTILKSKYEEIPEYYDILTPTTISRYELFRTISFKMSIRVYNPAGHKLSIMYRANSLSTAIDPRHWKPRDEIVYDGTDSDIQRAIDCPLMTGQHEASLWVYRGDFLLFEFANFKYTVE